MDALCFFLIQRYLRLSVSYIALLLFIAYEQQTAKDKAYYRSRQHDNVIHRTVFDDHYSGEDADKHQLAYTPPVELTVDPDIIIRFLYFIMSFRHKFPPKYSKQQSR